eukprot:4255186-Amphidinium_carterae.1
MEVSAPGLEPMWLTNVVCWGTRLQQVYRMNGPPSSEQTTKHLLQWVRAFGVPEVLTSDGGGEYKKSFADTLENLGVFHHVTDAYAPHQNGKTERAGGAFKQQLGLALENTVITSHDELELLCMEVAAVRNAYVDRRATPRISVSLAAA